MATDNSKNVKRGDELITALKCILEDNSKILQNQEEIKELLQQALPPKAVPFVRC